MALNDGATRLVDGALAFRTSPPDDCRFMLIASDKLTLFCRKLFNDSELPPLGVSDSDSSRLVNIGLCSPRSPDGTDSLSGGGVFTNNGGHVELVVVTIDDVECVRCGPAVVVGGVGGFFNTGCETG